MELLMASGTFTQVSQYIVLSIFNFLNSKHSNVQWLYFQVHYIDRHRDDHLLATPFLVLAGSKHGTIGNN